MADSGLFAADPERITTGGGITDQISTLMLHAADDYATATAWDPQDPPWGNDDYGNAFAANYVPVHTDLRDAYTAIGNAVMAAGAMTVNSGKSFHGTQGDAIDAIHGSGGGGGRR